MGRKSKGQTRHRSKKLRESAKSASSADGDANDDDRFLDLSKNPMFREMPHKERKIQIDDRFKQMLTNKDFQERVWVDKRGRPVKKSSDASYLSKLYRMGDTDKEAEEEGESSTSENEQQKVEDEKNDETQTKQKIGEDEDQSDCDTEEEDEEEEDQDLPQIELDLARGQGNISSSSSGDEEDPLEMDDEQHPEGGGGALDKESDNWGELDKDVKRVEWASRRLAVCNLNWASVRAVDLMLVLNSLKPTAGEIHSVAVYLSDFGAKCLQEEKDRGPQLKLKPTKKTKKGVEDETDLEERTKQAIRAYEMDKLRYYYAVCVCDSIDTATTIYEACDGVEYESSGLKFDIRFVPDEMEFEDERIREKVSGDQFSAANYKPKKIGTHSLAVSNPKMDWEEIDPERRQTLRQAFSEEAKIEQFDHLVASGSEEDEAEGKANYEILMAAAREGNESTKMEESDEKHKQEAKMDIEWNKSNVEVESDEDEAMEDRELTDEQISDEEAVEVPKQKKKTKFQIYLERKKQLKQERKQNEQEQQKQRKGKSSSGQEVDEATSTRPLQVEKDGRFSALFTDSAFAIDRTSASYKGGDLADRQVKCKHKRQIKLSDSYPNDKEQIKRSKKKFERNEEEDIVEKWKRRSKKNT